MTTATISPGDALISRRDLRHLISGCDMTLSRWMRQERDPFPRPARIINHQRFWSRAAVLDWIGRRDTTAPRTATTFGQHEATA